MYELYINNGSVLYKPAVKDGVSWETERAGAPGKLEFEVYSGSEMAFEEGNAVGFKADNGAVFFGFVFTKKRSPKNGTIKVSCYDQLRYFKNKATYVYSNKTATALLKGIAADFRLNTGSMVDTQYLIPSRVEENTQLFGISQTALDLTLMNTGKLFVLFDDYGSLVLANAADLKTNILIDSDTAEDYEYTSTIDKDTYNQIKVTLENEEEGITEVYLAQDSKNINKWGLLTKLEGADESISPISQADGLLKLYNAPQRTLTVKKALGDIRARAGFSVYVRLSLDDEEIDQYLLIEKAKHTFKENNHEMDLTLRGGGFSV